MGFLVLVYLRSLFDVSRSARHALWTVPSHLCIDAPSRVCAIGLCIFSIACMMSPIRHTLSNKVARALKANTSDLNYGILITPTVALS